MSDYKHEVEQLRAEFLRIDVRDSDQLRGWLQRTDYLNTAEQALITRRKPVTVRRWKQRLGLATPKPYRSTGKYLPRNTRVCTIEVPDNWRTPEWLGAMSTIYSTRELGRACGVSHVRIIKLQRQFGIVHQPKRHPLCTYQWVYDHYVDRRLSQEECAQLAGVTRPQFCRWLTILQIPIRRTRETIAARRSGYQPRTHLWTRRLKQQLQQQPEVRRVLCYEAGMKVRYRTGVSETYWYGERGSKRRAYALDGQQSRIQRIPPIFHQYPNQFSHTDYPWHVLIQRSDWDQASIMEQRLAVQQLLRRLWTLRWSQPLQPPQQLQQDWQQLQRSGDERYLVQDTLQVLGGSGGRPNPGWMLALHYFDLEQELRNWRHPQRLYAVVDRVAKQRTTELSTSNVIRAACSSWGVRLISPLVYTSLLRSMRVRGPVLDLYPGLGHRAMACALLGLKYLTPPDSRFQQALQAGFGDRIGLDWEPDDGRPVQLVIADDQFRSTDLAGALAHAGRTRQLLGFVPHQQAAQLQLPAPERILKVRTRVRQQQHDYLYLW